MMPAGGLAYTHLVDDQREQEWFEVIIETGAWACSGYTAKETNTIGKIKGQESCRTANLPRDISAAALESNP
jgi:hypothetical protein